MILLVLFIVFSSFVGLVALAFLIRSSILRLKVDNITSRYVFITGCDTGFGNLLTQMLDAKGVSVFAGCLTPTGARDLSDKTSSRVQTVLLDVTDKESVTKAYEIVKSKLPHDTGKMPSPLLLSTFSPYASVFLELFLTTALCFLGYLFYTGRY